MVMDWQLKDDTVSHDSVNSTGERKYVEQQTWINRYRVNITESD